MAAIDAEALGDLAGQFAGGAQHQAAAAAPGRGLGIGGQTLQDRQGEGGGLAGAGLGDAQQVAAGQDGGNGLGLDRRGGRIAFLGQGLQKGLGEAKVGEVSQGGLFRMRQTRALTGVRLVGATVVRGAPRVAGRSVMALWRSTG